MIADMQAQIDQYWRWLRGRTSLRQVGDCIEITTPYLDRHNDCFQIYVKRENGQFVLTNDGYVVEDLEMSGCRIDSPKRQDLFKMTLDGFGVEANGKALEVRASPDNLALRKHNLVQAMLAVNDLFFLASSTVASLFHEDVTAWLDHALIRYTPNVRFAGKSGYDHRFDYVIPKSPDAPEHILCAINRPNRTAAQTIIFSWTDTKKKRAPDSLAFAILNDTKQKVSESVLDALRNYEVHPVTWSNRDEAREQFAA